MLQLVGIAHHIDRFQRALLDEQCGRLKQAVRLAGDETGQTVDVGVADQRLARALLAIALLGVMGFVVYFVLNC